MLLMSRLASLESRRGWQVFLILLVLTIVAGAAVCAVVFNWARRREIQGRYANVLVLEASLILLFGLLADQLTWLALFGVNVTAVTRVAAELLPHAYAWLNLIAAAAWMVVFTPWVLRYAPLYLRPRADGESG